MARHSQKIVIVVLLLTIVPPVWAQQFFIYSPKPVPQEEAKQPKDGILVRSVPVQNGDSLYSIAQKIIGRGMYYPQILLFNDIKSPNDIRPGDTIKVPVPKERPIAEDKAVQTPKGKVSKPVAKEQLSVAEEKWAPVDKAITGKPLPKAPVKHKAASTRPVARKPAAGKPASQLSELALSEFKPSAEDKKIQGLSQWESPKVRKSLKFEQTWKEKPQAIKKQPVTEDEVRPTLASRQPEQRQSGKIPISPDEIRPVIAATRYQDMEPYQAASAPPLTAMESSDSQRLFEQAIKAYRQDDCIKALDLFGNFLSTYPDLPQASDATLYKAECFMKLSKQ